MDLSLRVDDIDGAKAKIRNKFLFTNRHVDPLNPQYDLPSFHKPDDYSEKFIKDPLDCSDIEGTKSQLPTKYKTRPINMVEDIEGAQASWRPRHA